MTDLNKPTPDILQSLRAELHDSLDGADIELLSRDTERLKAYLNQQLTILDRMSKSMLADAKGRNDVYKHYQTALRAQNQFRATLMALHRIEQDEERAIMRAEKGRRKQQRAEHTLPGGG